MPSFQDVATHAIATATDVQQIIAALSGRANTPLAVTITDPIAYALTLKNTDPSSRALTIYASDGTTVLFSVDASGAKVSQGGGAAVAPITQLGPGAGQAAEGPHIHGIGSYLGAGSGTLEALYAGSKYTTAVNYVVTGAILFVYCTTGVVVTLPAAATTNRPIEVIAVAGTTTVNAAGGSVVGGSINMTTGLVMDGVVSPGEAMTWSSNGTSWFVV